MALRAIAACIGLTFFACASFAQREIRDDEYPVFYTIKETARKNGFESATELMASVQRRIVQTVSMLDWDLHQQQFPRPPEKYNRDKHFGDWIDDPRDPDCFNTRAKVLIRDSRVKVKLSSKCFVASGQWADPYAGKNIRNAADVQIDHVVALKNAYNAGAFRWSRNFRCLYGNYLGNGFHLLPVDADENMQKSASTPADWMPRNPAYRCEFLANWLKIKWIWGLVMSPREAQAIRVIAQRENCSPQVFDVPAEMLAQQRQVITANQNLCQGAFRRGF